MKRYVTDLRNDLQKTAAPAEWAEIEKAWRMCDRGLLAPVDAVIAMLKAVDRI